MVADYNAKASDVVHLNVGGKERISVPRATLTLCQSSMLAAMFSGRHKVCMWEVMWVGVSRPPEKLGGLGCICCT